MVAQTTQPGLLFVCWPDVYPQLGDATTCCQKRKGLHYGFMSHVALNGSRLGHRAVRQARLQAGPKARTQYEDLIIRPNPGTMEKWSGF